MTQPVNHQLDPAQRLTYEARPADMLLWSPQYYGYNTLPFNLELEQYLPQNRYIASTGELILEGRNTYGGDPTLAGGKYTSGMCASYNRMTFLYGYVEASIKFPTGYGVWPAFWMLYSSVSAINEIDICEIFESSTQLNCGVHFPGGATHDGGPYTTVDMSQSYHAFAVDWQPSYIAFYFDGQPLFRTENLAEIPSAYMYVLLNVAISGVAVGSHIPADIQFPLQMHVQYVRVWQYPGQQLQLTVTDNFGTYNAATALTGAFAHYPLSDKSGTSATDLISGNNGTITGDVILNQPAIIGDGSKSMLFNSLFANTGYISLPGTVNPAGWRVFAAEIWFVYTSSQTAGRLFDNAHTDATNTGFQMTLNATNGGLVSLATTNKTSNLYWGTAFVVGTPYHYMLVYDGVHVYAYLNGVQVGNDTLTGTIVASSYAINIGRGAYGNDYWTGRAGQASIYNAAPTSVQVVALYNAGLAIVSNLTTITMTSPTSFVTTGTSPYDIGDAVPCIASFTANGTAVDPVSVIVRVKNPLNVVATYRYGTDLVLFKDAVGIYHLSLYPDVVGTWLVRFEGSGLATEAIEATFTVKKSAFY